MYSTVELTKALKAEFPLLFDAKELVSAPDFYQAYNEVAEHSIRATDPPLKPETHKHQWTLMGFAIGLIALVLFKVGEIKVAEALIDVDCHVLMWYSVFVSALLLTYLLRVAADFKRAKLARQKDSEKLTALSDLVEMALAVRSIQQYYWLELFHQIGERYAVYLHARSFAGNAASAQNIDIRVFNLDIEALKKASEFRSQIEGHEIFIKSLIAALDKDVERFKDKVEIFNRKAQAAEAEVSDWGRYSHIRDLFERYLKPWFDLRNSLTDVQLDVVFNKRAMRESLMLDAQLAVLKQARNIRRMYAISEVVLPCTLALASIIYAVKAVWG